MKEYTVKTFTIDELSGDAKQTALENNYDWNVSDSFWSENVIDDAKEIGKIIGIEIENVYFSGFSSQGDGACFEGVYSYAKDSVKNLIAYAPKDAELHRIAKELQAVQRRYFYSISAVVNHRGHYMHSGCTIIQVEDLHNTGFYSESNAKEEVEELLRDFMDWIYRRLETEYNYQTSEKSILESLRSNQVEFLADGKSAHCFI